MASEGKAPGDIMNKSGNYTGGGAADEYYKYMLLAAKAGNNSSDTRLKNILASRSEREEIEVAILDKLVNIGESSPEFSQVAEITGSRDKFEMARILAEIVYDKARAEQILQFYTPNKTDLTNHFLKRTAESFAVRGEALTGALVGSAASPISAALSALGFQRPA